MAFNTKQEDTNYTLMISKVSNGYVLHLLNEDGETVRSAIASEYSVRDYSSYSLCSAIEELWSYAEKLEKAAKPQVTIVSGLMPVPDMGTAVYCADIAPEAKESEL